MNTLALAALLLASNGQAAAGASNFVLVNGTDVQLADLAITRSGANEWKPLAKAPPPAGRAPVQFSNPDCAFDIRANVAGSGPVTWAGVNLCDVKSVTLKRDDSAGAWIDYDR